MDKIEAVQSKVEELLDLLKELENPEERVFSTLNSIILLAQSNSSNIFEFFGILDEAKFLYREEMLMDDEDDEDFVDDDEEGEDRPFSHN